MSVAAVKWAIGQKVGDVTAKSVLFVLAWHHNAETGLCCPSIPTLQTECDIKSDNTVKSALKRLAALGLVTSERDFVNGAIKRTRYSLVGFNPSEIEGGSAVEGGSVIEGGSITEGGAGNAGGVPQDLPLPSLNPCPTVPQLLPPKENEREEEKEQVEDIRPKLADDVPPPSVDDYGFDLMAEEREVKPAKAPRSCPIKKPEGVSDEDWADYKRLRREKRLPLTAKALKGLQAEADKAGKTMKEVVDICLENSWAGFKASWLKNIGLGRQTAPVPAPKSFADIDYSVGINPDGSF